MNATRDRAERYYLRADHQTEWEEVTREQFIAAEQAAGFRSRFGSNHPATGGFSGQGMNGRVDYVQPSSEFDKVFAHLESPDHPATCDQCGMEGTNASLEGHRCEKHVHDYDAQTGSCYCGDV